jgi:hypothetical protein
MSYTISVTAATTSANSPMQFVAAVATAGSEENGQALLWSTSTTLSTWLTDSASTAAEVTAISAYTDGYAAAFSYTLMASMLTTTGIPLTVQAGALNQTYGVCFWGTETVGTTTTAGTSCAGYDFEFTNSDDVTAMTITATMVQFYAPDNTDTIALTSASGTWTATTAVTTATGGSWVCQQSGTTFPTVATAGEVSDVNIIACQRFLPLEANSAAADVRFEPTVSGGMSGGIKLLNNVTLTASAITSLTGAFQAATVAGAVALAALTF